MAEPQIRFDDGAAYERMMGIWSRLAGDIFLDWLKPRDGLRWIDVGCGNGAFTQLIAERFAPSAIEAVDPSEGQLSYARTRLPSVQFQTGDAMALPFPADRFDIAVMALVIFFVPDPAKGVAEMTRVVKPGGTVAAYAWDMEGGGFPMQVLQTEMKAMGFTPVRPPQAAVSRIEALKALWRDAGLDNVETRRIDVQRTFPDFDDLWGALTISSVTRPIIEAMPPVDRDALKAKVRARLPTADADGRITYGAWAHAVKGTVQGTVQG